MPTPAAVLLDVGGVLFLPDHTRLLGVLARAGFTPPADALDRAHYAGATALSGAVDSVWPEYWSVYIDAFLTACDVPDDLRADAHGHLASEHATEGLWTRRAPGAADGLRALRDTGVRLGIISNSDGTVEQQLRDYDVAQVGPGPGIAVDCIIDSTVVGVSKPDPRIFKLALDAMGLTPADAWYIGDTPAFDVDGARAAGVRPLLLDPYRLHVDGQYERVDSIAAVAAMVRG